MHRRRSSRSPARAATAREHQQRVLRALVHIEDHLDSDLSLDMVARGAHMSPFHFQRVFTGLVGESPAAYVRRLRLERAAAELARTRHPLLDRAAHRAGYGRSEPFLRAFKVRFGTTPGAYQQSRLSRSEVLSQPDELRVWVNRPGKGSQMRFCPVSPTTREARRIRLARPAHLSRLRVAFLRQASGRGSAAEMFRRLTAFAINRAPELDSSGLMFMSLHHDDPRVTAATKRRIDRCVVIGPRRRGEGEIGIRTVGGADFVLATHEGTERDLSGFAEWQEEFGTRVLQRSRRSGAVIEVHLDDPRKWPARGTPRLSDVLVPVEAANDLMMWYVRRGRPPSLSSLPVLPSPALEQAKQNTGKKRSQS